MLEPGGLLRCARNDIPGTCHCEEQSDEAISIAHDALTYLRQRALNFLSRVPELFPSEVFGPKQRWGIINSIRQKVDSFETLATLMV